MLSKGHVSLLGVVLASFGAVNAARETLSVTEGGITFTVARYDDGRNKPYRLKFKQDGTRSLYMFDSTPHVTDIKVGTERFEVRYFRFLSRLWVLTERTCSSDVRGVVR